MGSEHGAHAGRWVTVSAVALAGRVEQATMSDHETPNHGYNVPKEGTQDWHNPLNENFEALDEDVETRDAGPPGSNGYDPADGGKYLDTTSGVIYESDGSTWNPTFALPAGNSNGITSLSGDLTGGQALTDIAGTNLSIDASGTLNASGGGGGGISSLSGGDGINPGTIGDGDTVSAAWGDANSLDTTGDISDFSAATDLDGSGAVTAAFVESLTGGEGISPSSIGDGDTLSVAPGGIAGTFLSTTVSDDLTVDAGSGLENDGSGNLQAALGSALGFDGSDQIAVTTDSVTVAGNPVSLGGSTDIDHSDLSTVTSDNHHTRPVAGNGLTESASTFNVGSGSYLAVTGSAIEFNGAAEWNGGNNTASGSNATVGGGDSNTASGGWTTVGGGDNNTADAQDATVGGGWNNLADGQDSTVGGGYNNAATALYATVAGGGPRDASNPDTTNNIVHDDYGAVGGGDNQAGTDDSTQATYATVAGGGGNSATGASAAVGGGQDNTAGSKGATVGGGENNDATSDYATIAGGGPSNPNDPGNTNNAVYHDYGTVGGGGNNKAGVDGAAGAGYATVAGGDRNTASANYATVAGGRSNTASGTEATVPGGARGAAEDSNSFVWNDGTGYHAIPNTSFGGLSSNKKVNGEPVTGSDTFSVSAQGGVRFITGSSSVTYIESGSTGWTTSSSRAVKTNVDPVDPERALAGVDSMDVATWEYDDGEAAGTTHIGPMAEDFHDAFDVGDSDEHINSVNARGVLFAAVQGLSEELDEKEECIEELEAEAERKDDRIDDLESRLERLEAHLDAQPADD